MNWRALIIACSTLLGCSANKGTEPSFMGQISNVTVALGREAVLSCSVANLDTFKVGWMKAEDQTILSLHKKVVTHNSRVSVTNDGDVTWRLHIRQVKESDRGCYMCQINTSTMSKQIGCIDVHVPPDIVDSGTSSDVSVDEGRNTTLSCRARGHPVPRILWRREDNQLIGHTSEDIFTGDNLKLYNVDRSHAGAYLCIATNDVPPAVSKRIFLSVNYPPELRLSQEALGGHLGSDVRIDCYVDAHPPPNVYWLFNDTVIQQSMKYGLDMYREPTKLRLTLKDISRWDFGSYTCSANNSMGSSEATSRLYEIILPTTTTTTTTQAPTTTRTTTTEPKTTLFDRSTIADTTPKDFESVTMIELYDNELESEGVEARIGVESRSICPWPNLILLNFAVSFSVSALARVR